MKKVQTPAPPAAPLPAGGPKVGSEAKRTVETGGPKGLEPTRYGDWEKNGKCVDF